MINLDYQSRTPIYKQIVSEIERYITLGILKPKEQLMSIREMAITLGINPNTVKKAYTELEQRGIIITVSTKGTFVADDIEKLICLKKEQIIEEIRVNIAELEKLGIKKEEIIQKLQ